MLVYRISQHIAYQDEKAASQLIAEYGGTRVVAFSLEPGQEVPVHTSPATVFMLAFSGKGSLRSGEESFDVNAGEFVIVPPNAPHAMAAGAERFVVLAFIQFPQ